MKKFIFLSVVLSIILIISGCEKENEVIQTSLLNKTWVHSYEETTGEIEIYRPGTQADFPPSRYRQSFYFEDNKACKYSVLAADDGHYVTNGNWEFRGKTKTLRIFNLDSEILYEFEVVELTDDILKLRII